MPTVVTKTVGAGRDYATPALAEAGVATLATSEFGGTDLVSADGAIVFDIDAGTYGQLACAGSGLTCDATRNVTYRAAAGAGHGGSLTAGVIITHTGNVLVIQDDFTTLEGLVATTATANYALVSQADGVTHRGLVLANTNSHVALFQNGTASNPTRAENCVVHATNGYGYYSFGTSTAAHTHIINCTLLYSFSTYGVRNYGGLSNLTLVNFLGLHSSGAAYQAIGSPTITGSNCFSTGTGALPAAVQGTPYPIIPTTSTTPGSGDYAIYNASTGALVVVDDNTTLGLGVGPRANSAVPALDILGARRFGSSCDPGAFEGDRSRSTDVWDVPAATHTTLGSFGELIQQIKLAATSAASSRATT